MEPLPSQRTPAVVAILLIAAIFFYFLLFAQFGFLHRLAEIDAEKRVLQPTMLLMGIGGLAGSIATARWWRKQYLRGFLAGSLLGSAVAAALPLLALPAWTYAALGLLIGLSLGVATVALPPVLALVFPRTALGRLTGVGVGLAYFASNLPQLFAGSPWTQCAAAALVASGAGILVFALPSTLPETSFQGIARTGIASDSKRSFVAQVAVFFALIWLDSAVFYLLQETPRFHDLAWGTAPRIFVYGLVHGSFAVVGGFLLDFGLRRLPLFLALGGLLLGSVAIAHDLAAGALLYVAGVSLYSTPLVAWSVFGASDGNSLRAVVVRAAWLFGLAGWVGSGLGVGMARDLHRVPPLFLLLSAAAVLFLGRFMTPPSPVAPPTIQ